MILSKTTPTCSLLFFEMTIFRNSIRNETEFYNNNQEIPSDDILEGLYKLGIRESEKPNTVLELYILEIFIRRKQDLIITDWWKEVSSKMYESRILKPETEIMKETQWTRISRGRSPSGRMFRLFWSNSFCEKWHPPECLICKFESGCKFKDECSYTHRQVEEQPSWVFSFFKKVT